MCRRVAVRDSQTLVYSTAASSSQCSSHLSTIKPPMNCRDETFDIQRLGNTEIRGSVREVPVDSHILTHVAIDSPLGQKKEYAVPFRIPSPPSKSRLVRGLTELPDSKGRRLRLHQFFGNDEGDSDQNSSVERDLQSSGSLFTLHGVEVRKKFISAEEASDQFDEVTRDFSLA